MHQQLVYGYFRFAMLKELTCRKPIENGEHGCTCPCHAGRVKFCCMILLHMFQASINMHQHLYLSLKLSNAISEDTSVGKHAENNE